MTHPRWPDPVSLRAHLEARMPAALEWLRRMVGENSYTGNAAGVNRVSDLTEAAFAPFGFTAERVPSSHPEWGAHLVLTRPGTGPATLAMVSHLDTVFPPEEEARNNFRWQEEGDRIFGPGTQDIKGGTVMMWLVLDALRAFAPDAFAATQWKLFWNSSEETLSADFGVVCRARLGPETRAALVFEAEGRRERWRRVVVARKGRATWRVRVSGRAAHAGGKHAHGANAIVQLGRTVQQLAALTDPARALTVNVGRIEGGGGVNRVPHEAWAEGEFRAFDPAVYAAAKAAVLGLAGEGEVRSVADGFPCRIEVEILSESRPWPRNGGTDGLLEIWREAAVPLGLAVEGEERGGLSDGNLLWDLCPTIDGLGPWGDNDHCSERSADGTKLPEFVEISSFVPKAALNVMAILRLLGRG